MRVRCMVAWEDKNLTRSQHIISILPRRTCVQPPTTHIPKATCNADPLAKPGIRTRNGVDLGVNPGKIVPHSPYRLDPVSHQSRHSYLGKRETGPYPLPFSGSEEARITFILQFAFRYSHTHTLPL